MSANDLSYYSYLLNLLNQRFTVKEIHALCVQLGFLHKNPGRPNKTAWLRDLLALLSQERRLFEFVALMQQEKPHLEVAAVPENFVLPATESPTPSAAVSVDNKREKVLDAAAKNEVKVGKSTNVLVLIRGIESKGLKELLEIEPDYGLQEEDVRTSRVFYLDFPVDESGKLLPMNVEVAITAPDFAPERQSEIVKVTPDDDTEHYLNPVEFMLTPLITGDLRITVEVFELIGGDRKRIGSRFLLTDSKENPCPHAKYRVISLQFGAVSIENIIDTGGGDYIDQKGQTVKNQVNAGGNVEVGQIGDKKKIARKEQVNFQAKGGSVAGGDVAGRDMEKKEGGVTISAKVGGSVSFDIPIAGRDQQITPTTYHSASDRDELTKLFAPLLEQVQRQNERKHFFRPHYPEQVRRRQNEMVVALVRALLAEIARGEQADDKKVSSLIMNIANAAPAVIETLVWLFSNSIVSKAAGAATRTALRFLQRR